METILKMETTRNKSANPRARRMLMMVYENDVDEVESTSNDTSHPTTTSPSRGANIASADTVDQVDEVESTSNGTSNPTTTSLFRGANIASADTVDQGEVNAQRAAGDDENFQRSRYDLRDLVKAKYIQDEDDNIEKDYSPDISGSEYCPSPERRDTPLTELLKTQSLRTPSVISNLSFLLENVDFVASPTVLYKVNSNMNTPSQVRSPDQRSKTYTDLDTAYYSANTRNEVVSPTLTLAEGTEFVNRDQSANLEINFEVLNQNEEHEALSTNYIENQDEPSTTQIRPLTRKRIRHPEDWQDRINKKLKDSGQEYRSVRSKKVRPAKQIGPVCSCTKKCFEKFSHDERKELFKQFWDTGKHEMQWQHILKYVKKEDIKKMTLLRKQNRTQTIKYYLPRNTEGELTQVCKVFFLNTLSISDALVFTALEKAQGVEGFSDKRGVHNNRPRKMDELTEESVKTHITMFPVKESHYIRKQSKRQYLSENLNISRMHRLYQEWFKDYKVSNPNTKEATKRQYETIFNTQFNYSFFKPKKDRCATCALYEEGDADRKAALEENYRAHIQRKERIREIKYTEKKNVDPTNTTVATFDLEKVLNIPQSNVGIFHYKRNYPIYNFTVFEILRRKGYCYVWHYEIAKRGAIEIGSCLLSYIQSEYNRGIRNFSFYSDSCAGQNKNRFIFALYVYCAKKLNINITHRFFEVGHSQSEGDSMHACIEKAKDKKIIYTPEQMYAIILNSKVTEKYSLKEMQQPDFLDIKALTSGKNWARDTTSNKVMWSKVKEVTASSSQPDILEYKYDFDDEYSSINTQTQTRLSRGRKSTTNTAFEGTPTASAELQQAYNQPFAIPKALYNDLMNLCNSEAIPRYYQPFYRALKCEDNKTARRIIDDTEDDNDTDDD